jgi:hypothetical protein
MALELSFPWETLKRTDGVKRLARLRVTHATASNVTSGGNSRHLDDLKKHPILFEILESGTGRSRVES